MLKRLLFGLGAGYLFRKLSGGGRRTGSRRRW